MYLLHNGITTFIIYVCLHIIKQEVRRAADIFLAIGGGLGLNNLKKYYLELQNLELQNLEL